MGVLDLGFGLLCRTSMWIWTMLRMLSNIIVARLRLRGRGEDRSDPEFGDQYSGSGSGRIGQHEAPGSKRAAVRDEYGYSKRARCKDEEDFDDQENRVATTDQYYCDYDSTWDTEPGEASAPRSRSYGASRYPFNNNFMRFERAARDMHMYRHDYPGKDRLQNKRNSDMPNLMFYLQEIPSKPDDVYIHEFHLEWWQQYDSLEYVHTYIQWLFPLQEPGMNSAARPMTSEEVEEFRKNKIATDNLLKSYKLMLDFYGIQLCDEDTGKVTRANNWSERFDNLNSHSHNNLRITRILKCLGTLGYEHYQAPLVRFFLEETLIKGELPSVKESVLNYFLFAVRDKKERRELLKFAYLNYGGEEFVWCPKKIQMFWSRQMKTGEARAVCDLRVSPEPEEKAPNRILAFPCENYVSNPVIDACSQQAQQPGVRQQSEPQAGLPMPRCSMESYRE